MVRPSQFPGGEGSPRLSTYGKAVGGERFRRAFLPPEFIQISSMDCGVASIACLLAGYGLPANYERLREACQTDVDGTSINTLEQILERLGIDCCQHIIPDDLALEEVATRLPAVVVVNIGSGGLHFSVLWRKIGQYWLLMDPAIGRKWMREDDLRRILHRHSQPFSPADFREWAEQSAFLDALQKGLWDLTSRRDADELLKAALSDPTWHSLAALDASQRFVRRLRREAGGRPSWVAPLLRKSFEVARLEAEAPVQVPEIFWAVRGDADEVTLTGAVALAAVQPGNLVVLPTAELFARLEGADDLRRAIEEPPRSVYAIVRDLLGREYRLLGPALMALCFAATASGVAEVLIFRAALKLPNWFQEAIQRIGVSVWVCSFLVLGGLVDLTFNAAQAHIGRVLETRVRLAIFSSLPGLDDHFIHSRPTSDLAQRAQTLHFARELPAFAVSTVRAVLGIITTLIVLATCDIYTAILASTTAAVSISLSYLASRRLGDVDARLNAHSAALLQIFQDSLLGIVPLRVHGAESALRSEHRKRLAAWSSAASERLAAVVGSSTLQDLATTLLLLVSLLTFLHRTSAPAAFVLVLFWALKLPSQATALLTSVQAIPPIRMAITRALEPVLAAPRRRTAAEELTSYGAVGRGASIRFENVSLVASGQTILEPVNLSIRNGQHVAIVGRSGAGKSTFLSLLLGLKQPTHGQIFADGMALEGETLQALRRQTAWVDPSVHLWSDTMLANVTYGTSEGPLRPMSEILEISNLSDVVSRLQRGLMTNVGFGGGLLSGGEGQRIRIARALANDKPRLVLLDEPFRGLDRDSRRAMMQKLRESFVAQTLVAVTHDVEMVMDFDRVLVVENGQIVEDGPPAVLLEKGRLFAALCTSDLANQASVWGTDDWRKLVVADGQIHTGGDPKSE